MEKIKVTTFKVPVNVKSLRNECIEDILEKFVKEKHPTSIKQFVFEEDYFLTVFWTTDNGLD